MDGVIPVATARGFGKSQIEATFVLNRLKPVLLRDVVEEPLEFVEAAERDHDSPGALAIRVHHHLRAERPPQLVFHRHEIGRAHV